MGRCRQSMSNWVDHHYSPVAIATRWSAMFQCYELFECSLGPPTQLLRKSIECNCQSPNVSSSATCKCCRIYANCSMIMYIEFYLTRIRIVCTRPRRSTSIARIVFDQPNNSAVRATNHCKTSDGYDEYAPADHKPPSPISLLLLCRPVVIEPHAAHRLETDSGTEQRADERDQAVEFWYGACNYVRHLSLIHIWRCRRRG